MLSILKSGILPNILVNFGIDSIFADLKELALQIDSFSQVLDTSLILIDFDIFRNIRPLKVVLIVNFFLVLGQREHVAVLVKDLRRLGRISRLRTLMLQRVLISHDLLDDLLEN